MINDDRKGREDDKDGGDGEGENGEVGGAADVSLTPSSNGKTKNRSAEDAAVEDDLEAGNLHLDNQTFTVEDLVASEELPNDMIIGMYRGHWYVFDTGGTNYGPFESSEVATEFAFSIRPWGPTP